MIIPQETVLFKSNSPFKLTKYLNLKSISHWHDETEFIYIDKGTLHITVNKNMYIANEGDFLLCESGDTHSLSATDGSIVSVLQFDNKIFSRFKNFKINSPFLKNCTFATDKFKIIADEIKNDLPFANESIFNIIESLLIFSYRVNGYHTAEASHGGELLSNYRKLIDYADANYSTVTFEQACKIMSFTPAYFSKIFKELSGTTFSNYLNIIKTEKSLRMLESSDKSIAEIAMECGFGSIRHYNRVFKQLTGYSPTGIPDNYTFNSHSLKISKNKFNPTQPQTEIVTEWE